MAWFQKRLRRVSLDRSRPVPQRPGVPLTPPGKGAARFAITLFFLIGGIAALNVPSGAPRIKVGDIAQRDYRARVQFVMPDPEATERARQQAAQAALRVFREDTAEIRRLPQDLLPFLNIVRTMSNRGLADLDDPIHRSRWGVDSDRLRVLRNGLTEDWLTRLELALPETVNNLIGFGIMDSSARQPELMSERYEILVQADTDSVGPVRRSVALALQYPTGLREALADDRALKELLADRSPEFQKAFLDVLTHAIRPTLKPDPGATDANIQAAMAAVEAKSRLIPAGSILLSTGDRVSAGAYQEILAERRAFAEQTRREGVQPYEAGAMLRDIWGGLGITGIFLLGFLLVSICARHMAADALASNTRLFGFYTVFLAVLATMRILERFGWSIQWAPVALASMFFTITLGPGPALASSALLSVVGALVTNGGMSLAISLFLGATVASLMLLRVRRRTHVMEAGVVAGIVQFGAIWAMWTVQTANAPLLTVSPAFPSKESLTALGGGILSGFVFTAVLPYVEQMFDVATDLRLLEWTDQNQPLLRKLALEAPGTYHHSTVVSNMAEAAAEEVGANTLLARAGAYLHDVGKLNRPEYFVENTNGQPSPHDQLSARLSALILTAHTKDGEELAAQYGVPAPLRRIIEEHHGTCVVEFFYNKALKEAEGDGANVSPEDFRYRGPKPRSPEAAIVMLADSAESASRSMENASPAKLEKLVHDIVEKRLKDGQLDDSRMDITEIRAVEKRLVRSLIAISHPRIRYPSVPGAQ